MIINGYKLISEWKKREFFLEAKAEQDDNLYYMKKYPKDMIDDSEMPIWQNDFVYDRFCDNRVQLLNALKDYRESVILPCTAFILKDEYYEVIEKKHGLSDADDIYRMHYNDVVSVIKSIAKHFKMMHSKRIVLTPNKKSFFAREPSSDEIEAIVTGIEYADFELNFDYYRVINRVGKYISPELAALKYASSDGILENKITCKSDVFILGLIFHDYLTGGEMPVIVNKSLKFEGDKCLETCADALNFGAKLAISGKIKEDYLSHLIINMLHPDPAQRLDMEDVFNTLTTREVVRINNNSAFIDDKKESISSETSEKNPSENQKKFFESFCDPWEEHEIEFNYDALKSSKYVKVERFVHYGVKCYKLFKETKSLPKIMTVENLIMLDLVSKIMKETVSTGIKSDKLSDAWEEHSSYKFDMTEIREARYIGVKTEIRENKKGYALITEDGRIRFFTFEIMVYMGYLKLK